MIRKYSDLQKLTTFIDRYNYLRLTGHVGEATFGFDRFLNQSLYASSRWKRIRDLVIIRDGGCDLGIPDYELKDKIVVHHMNPITLEDLEDENPIVFDPEYLICTSTRTHQAIHYGDKELLTLIPIVRRPGDTCPWL